MILNGVINDIKPTGLFSEKTDLEVWDSIAGHSKGLQKIAALYNQERTTTNFESIDIPHRNGIIHGLDINFNNKQIAIKSFVLLFVIVDWIKKSLDETERKTKNEEEKNISLSDIQNSNHSNKVANLLIDKWNKLKRDKFEIQNPKSYQLIESTPEYTAIRFFELIMEGNFGDPSKYHPDGFGSKKSSGKITEKLRESFEDTTIRDITKMEIQDTASARSEILVSITYTYRDDIEKNQVIKLQLNYELDGIIENRLVQGGQWKIVYLEDIGYKLN